MFEFFAEDQLRNILQSVQGFCPAAYQNTEIVSIRFLLWETHGSLALILFIALVAGALISYLATTPGQIKQRMANSSQRKQIAEHEGQLASTQTELQNRND